MPEKKKNQAPRFFRSSFCYLLGSLISKAAVFFMLPLYTRKIPSADLGVYDTATAIAVLVASVLFLDIGVGIMRFLLSGKTEESEESVLASGLFIILFSSALYLIVAAVIVGIIRPSYGPLIILYGLLNSVMMALGIVARAKGYALFYALSASVATLIQVILNLILILGFGWGYESLYFSFCVGAGISILMLWLRCRIFSVIRLRYLSFAQVRKLLWFCLPLGVNSAAFWLLNSLNRVLVTVCLGAQANGYYAVAMKFTQILVFVSTCFQYAWQEVSFAKGYEKGDNSSLYYSERTDLFLRIFMSAILMLIPAARIGLWIFPSFIHQSYAEAVNLIPIALFGTFVSVLSSFLAPIFETAHKNKMILLSTVAGAAVNLAVILLLFRLGVGVVAANISFLAGYTVTVTIRLLYLHHAIDLQVRPIHLCWFLPASALVLISFLLMPPIASVPVLIGMTALAVAVLSPEIRAVARMLKVKKHS